MRDFVRSAMIPPVLARVYDIGMGSHIEQRDMFGRIFDGPAAPGIQLGALEKLIDIAVPARVGIEANGQEIPAVFVIGGTPEELDRAREAASHGDYQVPFDERRPAISAGMHERVERGEYEIVEVDESADMPTHTQPKPYPAQTTEQRILQRRQHLRATKGAKAV